MEQTKELLNLLEKVKDPKEKNELIKKINEVTENFASSLQTDSTILQKITSKKQASSKKILTPEEIEKKNLDLELDLITKKKELDKETSSTESNSIQRLEKLKKTYESLQKTV